ncbi:MAG: hypothetical protein IK104_05475 [Clostridia bacterium]|nr:hypothetical protein [Clostridia bacterium]
MKRGLIHIIRAACLALGAVFVWLGLSGGEFTAVLQKAVKICLECIGIG